MRSDSSYRVPVIPLSPRRTLLSSVALIALTALMTTGGCSASPEPKPKPTSLFASEEEAFAAAEEVYREYVDGVNARIADKSSPDPQDYLVGEALEVDISAMRSMAENRLEIQGVFTLVEFRGVSAELRPGSTRVDAIVCVDTAGARLIDETGADVTPASDPDRSGFRAALVEVGNELKISSTDTEEEASC